MNDLASAQHDLGEQQLQYDIDMRHRRSPKSDFMNDMGENEEKLSLVKNFNMAHDHDEASLSQISDMTFFSRVIDDIQYYHSNAHQNFEASNAVEHHSKLSEQIDDNFQMEGGIKMQQTGHVTQFTLKKLDFWLYIIGMLVRIQTIVLGYILFGVETDNTCVVVWESYKPLPVDMLPDNLNNLPGGFFYVSRVFETILLFLFITSCATSVMYINKVVHVIKWHRSSSEDYIKNAMPAVRKYKIWNTIFGIFHFCCFTIFATHAGRVCSGWAVGKLTDEER